MKKKNVLILLFIFLLIIFFTVFFNQSTILKPKNKDHYKILTVSKQNQLTMMGKIQPIDIKNFDIPHDAIDYRCLVSNNQFVSAGDTLVQYTVKKNNIDDNDSNEKINKYIYAPFSGLISINYSKQDLPEISLISSEKIFKSNISELDYKKIHYGDKLIVRSIDNSLNEHTFINYISQIPDNMTKGTAYYQVTAKIDNKFLYGQSVKAEITKNKIVLPKKSVLNKHVYLIQNNKVKIINIDGVEIDNKFIVNSGLHPGQKIILNPKKNINNGMVINND